MSSFEQWWIENWKSLEFQPVLSRAFEEWARKSWDAREGEVQNLRQTIMAMVTVIEKTHTNGYGHFNPWSECPAESCVTARMHLAQIGGV